MHACNSFENRLLVLPLLLPLIEDGFWLWFAESENSSRQIHNRKQAMQGKKTTITSSKPKKQATQIHALIKRI